MKPFHLAIVLCGFTCAAQTVPPPGETRLPIIDVPAVTPPPLPPGLTNATKLPPLEKVATKDKHYEVVCTECETRQELKPTHISNTGSHSTPTGNIADRMLTFKCGQKKCGKTFTATDQVFSPKQPQAKLAE